jgi:hypothetical protein
MKELEEAREVARRTLNTCRELSDKSREDEAEIERLNHELISLQVCALCYTPLKCLLHASYTPVCYTPLTCLSYTSLTRLYLTRLLNASSRLLHAYYTPVSYTPLECLFTPLTRLQEKRINVGRRVYQTTYADVC